MINRNLIFDVGANDGADTAFYLGLGYSVVVIEADPRLAGLLNERFAADTGAGRVIVVNVAVTKTDIAAVPFFISADNSQSSLIRAMAERFGELREQITIAGRSLCSLFAEYGVPWYCKIDIEGYDAQAVMGMAGCGGRPAYISCEASGRPIGEVGKNEDLLFNGLDALIAQGYRQFKLVDQESFRELADSGHYDRLYSWPVRIRTKLDRWLDWKRIPAVSSVSGPFGDMLGGEWADPVATRRRMRKHFSHYYHHTKNKQFIFWVDIHGKY